MKFTDRRPTLASLAGLALAFLAFTGSAQAQTPATLGTADAGNSAVDGEWTPLSAGELEELIGPIALYPDDLIAIVLPASTYPLQIVQAARFLQAREANPELEPDAGWDDSVVALLNYPEVLELLNDDLDWTSALGEAVVYQQGDVLNAIQGFRDQAHAAGNLATDERQVVTEGDDGAITIAPADEKVVYVPYYDPARVVVHQHVPVFHYYPYAYPLYYYPYPVGYSFGPSLFWGVTTAFLISWHDHYLHVRPFSHFGHPYYGYSYYTPWYLRTSFYVNVSLVDNYYHWRPSYRHGGRPRHHVGFARLRDDTVIRSPRERRIRSGWIGDRRDDGGVRAPRPSAGTPTLDDRRVRRIRSGRYTTDDLRAGLTRDRSIGDRYRRPRGSVGSDRLDANDGRVSRSGFARVSPRTEVGTPSTAPGSVRDRGRIRADDLSSGYRGRVAPRGASPAARGLQRSPSAARSIQRATPTFGRVEAAQRRSPAAGRGRISREQPMSRPSARGGRAAAPAAIAQGNGGRTRAAATRSSGGAHGQARQRGSRLGGIGRNARAR